MNIVVVDYVEDEDGEDIIEIVNDNFEVMLLVEVVV